MRLGCRVCAKFYTQHWGIKLIFTNISSLALPLEFIHGADPNAVDISGNTILMGADPSMMNDRNQTSLNFAQMFEREKIVQYLNMFFLKLLEKLDSTF
jgi:hypothetical protein